MTKVDPAHSTRFLGAKIALGLRRMACHEQAESASNGYRAWIRTINNASKGREVLEGNVKKLQQLTANP